MNEIFKSQIENGECSLGIELGSTRIKAVLINKNMEVVSVGGFDCENRFENGIWTYHLDEIHSGLKGCYRSLKENVLSEYGVKL